MSFVNFTFGGHHSFDDMGIYADLISRPLFPEPKTIYQDIPGTDGELNLSDKNPKGRMCFKPRIIEFECHLAGDEEDIPLPTVLNHLIPMLAEGEEERLILDCDKSVYYKAHVANLFNLSHITEQSVTFPLIFKCDPFRYAINETVIEGKYDFDFVNDGYYAPFTFEVTGTAPHGFQLTNLTNPDLFISVNTPLDGATAVINTQAMDVTINGVSVLSKCEGTFFELSPGRNWIMADGEGANISSVLKFTERYL